MFPDWLGDAISIFKDISPAYESKYVPGKGRTPNQVAKDEGPGWNVGAVFWDEGEVLIHRKKNQKGRK